MPSKLEQDFAQALFIAQRDLNRPWVYGEPVQQLHFAWCCEHRKSEHTFRTYQPRDLCAACDDHHSYAHERDWAFDFAWPALMVAVECEGIVRPREGESVGRHQTADGYHKDLEKYAAAQERGWTVVRVSRRMVTSGEALRLTEVALQKALACPTCAEAERMNREFSEGDAVRVTDGEDASTVVHVLNTWRCGLHPKRVAA